MGGHTPAPTALAAHHPSIPATSETSSASSEVDPRAQPPLNAGRTTPQDTRLQGLPSLSTADLPSSRTSRSHSLAQNPSAAALANSPIKRKPLTGNPSPLATRPSSQDYLDIAAPLPKPEHRFSRSGSVDSPTLYYFPEDSSAPSGGSSSLYSPVSSDSQQTSQRSSPVAQKPLAAASLTTAGEASESRNIPRNNPAVAQTNAPSQHDDLTADVSSLTSQESDRDTAQEATPNSNPNNNNISTLSIRKAIPPHLSLGQAGTGLRAAPVFTNEEKPTLLNKPLPKSPGSAKLGTFFGWASSSSSSTNLSDKGFSPLPSPFSPKHAAGFTDESPLSTREPTTAHALAAEENPLGYCEAYLQTPPATVAPPPTTQIDEMEDELKAISAELASSIRREMDLEDLVDRLQAEINNPQAPGKRTSDYFSDSGYSSAKFSDYDASKEEIAQVQRRAEQEKAQIRLELTDKLQDERSRRVVLDKQIKELAARASQVDLAQLTSKDANGRVKDLENTCENLRRRLSEERQVKGNFEELLSALKGELQNAANERDNLRDEIVPQLRARVEGLEAQANDYAKSTYDSTKMQQELQSLKTENDNLRRSRNIDGASRGSRSNSAAGSGFKLQQPPLSRSNTVKQNESREALAERIKDVEAQRDALHSALKNLLERQEFQNRENEKKIKVLEVERERLLAASPRKAGFEKEMANLRQEINVLRRRAEETFEQKWQVERGLDSLKMDLDRAEEEIASLRGLLREKDILIPATATMVRSSAASDHLSVPATSASLEKSYRDLQNAYAAALERIKSLEMGAGGSQDEKTRLAMKRLEQATSASLSERDLARQEATTARSQLDSLQSSEKAHLTRERDLADQLRDSARRVEELAAQVRSQLAANAALRDRLSEAATRGDAEQKASRDRVTRLESRLRVLEEQLVAAQTAAEDRVARHEEEVTTLKDAHSAQLQRLRDASGGLRSPSPRLFPPGTAPSPLMSPRLSPSRPGVRRSATAPGPDGSADADTLAQVETLRTRVTELEAALAKADAEMQEVVGRMNAAQIEVMNLQEERETAARETRRLQREVEQERIGGFEKRFKTLTSEVR